MDVFDPPTIMELLWCTDRLRITVEPDGDGSGTVLTLVDTFGERGKEARDAAGWHECLDRLAVDLDGATPGEWGASWRETFAAYVDRLGPEAATIGQPAGALPAEP